MKIWSYSSFVQGLDIPIAFYSYGHAAQIHPGVNFVRAIHPPSAAYT